LPKEVKATSVLQVNGLFSIFIIADCSLQEHLVMCGCNR